MRISLLLVVYNEAERLPDFLAHIRPHVDEIVAVDQASTDLTRVLLLEAGAVLLSHPHYGYAEASRQVGYDACTGDWVLVLAPDETLTPYALERLALWCHDPTVDAYSLREVTTVGGLIKEDACHPRLFRRGTVAMTSQIHTEMVCITGRQVEVREDICILHHKTYYEQALDDARYQATPGGIVPYLS